MQFPLYSTQYEQKVIHILMELGSGGGGGGMDVFWTSMFPIL